MRLPWVANWGLVYPMRLPWVANWGLVKKLVALLLVEETVNAETLQSLQSS